MSRYEECTKCGFTQVYDTFRSICNRCNYDTKPKVVEKPRTDMHDSHDFVMESWIPEPESRPVITQPCFMCGYQFDPNELTASKDGLICDKCMYEDEDEGEDSNWCTECEGDFPSSEITKCGLRSVCYDCYGLLNPSVLPTNAALRKGYPVATGVIDYFPDAILAIAEVSKVGNEQHNPGKPLHWDKTKSTDHADALVRHLIERGTFDTDGMRHSAKVAWRALALLQSEIEKFNYER